MDEDESIGLQVEPTVSECVALLPRHKILDPDTIVQVLDTRVYFTDGSAWPMKVYIEQYKTLIAQLEQLSEISKNCVDISNAKVA